MKNKLKLMLPNRKYVESFAKGIKEARKENAKPFTTHFKYFRNVKDFPIYKKRVENDRKGVNLKKGVVPSTRYWAMVGNKFVGVLHLRRRLNKKLRRMGGHIGYAVIPSERRKGYATEMLRLGLKKAKKLGIKKALVTCRENNTASRKVIENNGGVLQNKIKEKGIYKLRFWIEI
ncbi:MAG: Acetyltransferase, GNAT family [Candidatus Nomurabacteria bacterium GW2011_GWF2_43_8]|uniref:Acetyltransferase, GNAT family n=3 Tax=Candidatus Nomuraibacteriota TaxID=1752729 RepID=A0A0G1HRP5_9BACT|nr:MAG: Acetyltransferase, GNAT family [Candidatus Nomurabacteria bacterium GW2011_GWF2_43_8]